MSNASVANLLLISFDRYFSITRPLTYRAKRTAKKATIMITIAWTISFFLWTPIILSWPYIYGKRTIGADECKIQFIDTNKYVTVGTALIAFYLPVCVMCILYFKIWRETIKRQKEVKKLQAQNAKKSNKKNFPVEQNKTTEIEAKAATKLIDKIENENKMLKKSESYTFFDKRKKKRTKFNFLSSCFRKLIDNDDDETFNNNNSIASESSSSKSNNHAYYQKRIINNENGKNIYLSYNKQNIKNIELKKSILNKKADDDAIYTIVIELPLNSKSINTEESADQILLYKENSNNQKAQQKVKIKQIKKSCCVEHNNINNNNEDSFENHQQRQKILNNINRNIQKSKRLKLEKKQDQKAAKTLSAILLAFIITCNLN
jgi:hypothetical protein